MASERLRQREVYHYYQSWLDSSVGFDNAVPTAGSRYHLDGSHFHASKDKALTAFAQLGCLRLNVKRGIVTLISKHEQYVLAEATQTLSLLSDTGDNNANDEVWFGNASLPRSQGISEAALSPKDYTATAPDGTEFTAPALVINDITEHEDYSKREYAGKGINFYCGVPITTQSGFTIGVYTLTDDKPRNGLSPNELRFLCEMSSIVMSHLESIKNEAARFRGEAMVLGLGRFVQGASTLNDDPTFRPAPSPSSPANEDASTMSPSRTFKGMKITAANPSRLRPVALSARLADSLPTSNGVTDPAASSEPFSAQPRSPTSQLAAEEATYLRAANLESGSKGPAPGHAGEPGVGTSQVSGTSDPIFSRAANILRQCADVDGVLFFDAVSTNLAKRSKLSGFRTSTRRPHRDGSRSRAQKSSPTHGARSSDSHIEDTSTNSGGSEESERDTSRTNQNKPCQLLGYSLDIGEHSSSSLEALKSLVISEKTVRRLIRHHPDGNLFHFGIDGNVSSSDGDVSTNTASDNSSENTKPKMLKSRLRNRTTRAIVEEIVRLVPQAQKVIWLPMWDFSKQRYSAGAFLWSKRAERLVLAQDDLVYLRTFANCIMVEVARTDAATADKAKSTFIANISHELRSPLHGILGNIDLLQDTALDDFQTSLTAAIESCGRTLSDTVDHVLDYAKINHLSNRTHRKSKTGASSSRHSAEGKNDKPSLDSAFDLAVTVEEVVEAVCASQAFQSKGQKTADRNALLMANDLRPESPIPLVKPAPHVRVILNVDPRQSWWLYSQPGAVRRILINLLGNALKYTDIGTVQVSLSYDKAAARSDTDLEIPFVLAVADTGRGMSADFVRNHAFTPFTQESQFSPGTGLGLSIVQQLVNSLGGRIELQSKQGVGTEFKVHLSLPRPIQSMPSFVDRHLPQPIPAAMSQMTLSLLSSEDNAGQTKEQTLDFDQSLEATIKQWIGLRISKTDTVRGDEGDCFLYTKAPPLEHLIQNHLSSPDITNAPVIIIAADAVERAELIHGYSRKLIRPRSKVEVISLPIGPQKLLKVFAKVLPKAFNLGVENARETQPKSSVVTDDSQTTAEGSDPPKQTATSPNPQPDETIATPVSDVQGHYLSPTSEPPQSPESSFRWQSKENESYFSIDRLTSKHPPISPSSSSGTASAPVASIEPGIRVLLVDDNHINLNILKACMKRSRWAYGTAVTGLDAVQKFQSAAADPATSFTHVLMDISMPVMDGIEATREIRQFERQQHRKKRDSNDTGQRERENQELKLSVVIALSGVASLQTQQEIFQAGADMFLPKPVNMRELVKVIAGV